MRSSVQASTAYANEMAAEDVPSARRSFNK